jgi:hypothetical protein
MKRIKFLLIALATGLSATPAVASGIDASGVVTATPDGPNFDYSITLTNSSSSTDPIGTFWFAWVPGKDFLPTSPSDITTPTGWSVGLVSNGGSSDGFGIQFLAGTGSLLAPGSSLSGFGFKSADTPAELAGNSPFYPTFPVTTSTVYNGAPFSAGSEQFTLSVQSVPEPSSLMLGLFGVVTMVGYIKLKKHTAIA